MTAEQKHFSNKEGGKKKKTESKPKQSKSWKQVIQEAVYIRKRSN